MAEKNPSATNRVVKAITDSIINGELKPGDRLLTEAELSKKYEVGRNSVREAVKQLEALSVLEIKRADGTYVAKSYDGRMLDPMFYGIILHEHDWKDFVELRSVIDIGTLHVALRNKDNSELVKKLRTIIKQMGRELEKEVPDEKSILDLDVRFHMHISATIKNPQIDTVNEYINRITVPSRIDTVRRWIELRDADAFCGLHEKIADVIEKCDTSRIEEVVEAHYVLWR